MGFQIKKAVGFINPRPWLDLEKTVGPMEASPRFL